jgi:4-amino-4-deoxy-L-arabinose transferase-like glycosyltransferase
MVGLLIFWLFAILSAFYVLQKPFTPALAQAVLRAVLDIFSALLVVGLGAALGRRVLIWIALHDLPTADLVWLSPALGLGLLGILSLGLGLIGGWHRPLIYALALVAVGLLIPDALALGRRLCVWRPRLVVGKWGRRYLIATLGLTLLLALAPPISWDGLFYHLTGPALYIAQGRITPLDVNIPHLSFPSLMEMLFGLAMLIRGDVAAKLLHLAYGLLLAALIYRLSLRWQGRERAGWSLLLFAAMPMVSVLAAWAYNDLALAFYQLGTLYAILAWQETVESSNEKRGWLWGAGVLSGLALGFKYTAFLLPLVGIAYLLWRSRRWRDAFTFALLTSLIGSPWYLRNWAFMGNPVYPFLFGGWNWDGFRAAWYGHAGTGIGWRPLQILALPATMTLGLQDVNYYDGRMGPLFLALAPALLWVVVRALRKSGSLNARKRQALGLLGGFAAVYAMAWTLGVIQSRALFQARLFLPGFVALTPLISESLMQLSALDRPRFSVSVFVRLVIGVVLAFNLVNQALDVLRFDPISYLVGYQSRPDYLKRVLGDHYLAMEALEEIVPEEGRVLFLWEPRSYYSSVPAQPDAILDNWSHLIYLYGDDDEVAAHLRRENVTHILLYRWGLDFVIDVGESPLPPENVEWLEVFIEKHLEFIRTVNRYDIYAFQR